MARQPATKPKSKAYIQEWMTLARLRQSDLVKLLGWSKAKANSVWHADQRINEDILEEVAPLVHARTYELLMHPDVAHQLRRLQSLVDDALERTRQPSPQPEAPPAAIPIGKRRA